MTTPTNIIDHTALLSEIEALKKENEKLKQCKRYGLVWEDHPEALDKKNIIPLLAKDDGLSLPVIADKKQNYLIEGDNYHALKALQHTHRSAIGIIYIDPPYNTGNEFVYNDKIVDKEDSFRHSKWLSFMEKRLKLARELMSDDGVIFISIDDNEQAQLKLLCDAVFGEANFVANMIWHSNKSVLKQSKTIRKDHEYILAYAKLKTDLEIKRTENNMVFNNIDNDIKGDWFSSNATLKLDKNHKNYYGIELPTGDICYRRWKFTEEEYLAGNVDLYFKDDNVPRLKVYAADYDKNTKVPSSILDDLGTTSVGSNDLESVFGYSIFSYPKPLNLVSYLSAMHPNKSATVLDFFAGSGTTGHAVMELNKEDGGNRNFILCTNNEVSDDLVRTHFFNEGHIKKNNKTEFNKFVKEHPDVHQAFLESETYESLGIARAVTRERIKRVIGGYTTPKGKDVEGLPNNLTYLKTKEFDKKEQYGFDRNLLADLAYNSHILKYPELNYESFQVDAFTDIDEIKLTTTKQPVAFVNTRDRESLADIVEQLTSRFGNKVIIETLESYFN